jgi:hypothetical protein
MAQGKRRTATLTARDLKNVRTALNKVGGSWEARQRQGLTPLRRADSSPLGQSRDLPACISNPRTALFRTIQVHPKDLPVLRDRLSMR